jgi:hypothetical protein
MLTSTKIAASAFFCEISTESRTATIGNQPSHGTQSHPVRYPGSSVIGPYGQVTPGDRDYLQAIWTSWTCESPGFEVHAGWDLDTAAVTKVEFQSPIVKRGPLPDHLPHDLQYRSKIHRVAAGVQGISAAIVGDECKWLADGDLYHVPAQHAHLLVVNAEARYLLPRHWQSPAVALWGKFHACHSTTGSSEKSPSFLQFPRRESTIILRMPLRYAVDIISMIEVICILVLAHPVWPVADNHELRPFCSYF